MGYNINSLNDEQIKALKETEGAVLVTAGAGSGKTRLLTHRIAYLIKECGVSPYNILAITFTNKATKEMQERVADMVEGANKVWISTFHSMCVRILRQDIDKLPPYNKNFTIFSENDSERAIKKVLDDLNNKDVEFKKVFISQLSNFKNSGQTLNDYLLTHSCEFNMQDIKKAIVMYDDYLKKNNAIDFDDLLIKTIELLKKFPDVLEYYSNRFKYILVDEFQDTNTVQYQLIKMLASKYGNVFVVGDEDQCIYSWRGANLENIFKFKKDFPNVKVFKLERNYRSTAPILQIANNVIKNNSARLDKKMWTEKKEGYQPVLYNAYDERDEALYVAQNIEKLIATESYKYDDFAVLMRMNALSRSLEEAFLSYNIPHKIYGGFKFYERVEIKNLIAYLRIFVNPKDDVSFTRIINFPKRGIGDGTIAKLEEISGEKSLIECLLSDEFKDNVLYKKFEDFIKIYKKISENNYKKLSDFVQDVISSFALNLAYNPKNEEDLNKILNIEQFISSIKDFESLNPNADLGQFLETITLSSDTDEIGQGGAVTIATVHAAKGLEFKVVFVIGLEEGVFPILRAFNSNHELEEERRLMYVALTRAEERLFLTHCTKRYLYSSSQYQMPSRFCKEFELLSFSNIKPKFETKPKLSESDKVQQMLKQVFKKEEKEHKDVSIYKVGQKVSHPRFGEGEIVEISDDGLVGDIIFEDFGKKSLMLELAPLEIL